MNYGFVSEKMINLKNEDEKDRYSLQLYEHIVTSKNLDLEGKDILEIGSGRGGGASYIARYMKPKTMTGIDLCKSAVEFCKKNYHVENLKFLTGDAMSLDFKDSSFDIVINVESSHRYPYMNKFLSEVRRILRPGGILMFTDFRYKKFIKLMQSQLHVSGMKVLYEENITENILKALEVDEDRRMDLISRLCPRIMNIAAKEFAGTKGTHLYKSFKRKQREYYHHVLQKDKKNAYCN